MELPPRASRRTAHRRQPRQLRVCAGHRRGPHAAGARSTTGTRAEPQLRALADAARARRGRGAAARRARAARPLPRAYEWVDGSAFLNHVILVRKARGAEPPPTLETDPLVYQGGSGDAARPARRHRAARSGVGPRLRAEVCVHARRHAAGHDAPPTRRKHVRLVMLANDVHAAQPGPRRARQGLRLLPEQAGDRVLAVRGHARRARRRVADGRAAPARAHRPTTASSSATATPGPEMHFSFFDLIAAHRARRARFTAGHHPRQRHGVATPTARAASRASPSAA